jgi:hypothetical protein
MKYSMLSGMMLKRAGLAAAVIMFAGACATTSSSRAPAIAGAQPVQTSVWDSDGDEQYVVRSRFFKDRGLHPTL